MRGRVQYAREARAHISSYAVASEDETTDADEEALVRGDERRSDAEAKNRGG